MNTPTENPGDPPSEEGRQAGTRPSLWSRLSGWAFPPGEPDLQRRIFLGLTLLGGLLSLGVVVPSNALQKLPLGVNAGVFCFGLAALGLHAAARRGRYFYRLLILLYLALLDLLWFVNAGSQGPIAMFFFPAAMYLVVFFRGWALWAMLSSFFANGVGLFLLERRFPAWVLGYPDPFSRYLDLLTGFVLGSVVCIMVLGVLLASHRQERARLRRAMDAIRESQQRYERTFRALPSALGIADVETGVFLNVNEGFTDLFSYAPEEVLGRRVVELRIWADPSQRQEVIDRLARGERVRNLPVAVRRKDGVIRQVSYSAEQVVLDGRSCLLSSAIDVTDRIEAEAHRRAMEAQLLHLQKLESLGRLAGGVAHDMNNVLSAILAVASVMEDQHPGEPATLEELRKIHDAALRGRDLVRGLTDFARKDLDNQAEVDLNQLMRAEAALLARTTRGRVHVELDLEEPLPTIRGEASALGSALMNLCINAVDAMPEGGRLVLRTRFHPPAQVEGSVEDDGSGMPPEILDRALEPFFTTKPVGQGTGLGLPVVFGTVKAHGGTLAIQSEPGRGTAVRILLPVGLPGEPAQARPDPEPEGGTRGLRLLLVDDDPLIQLSAPAMLEAAGHRVRTARGGLEALSFLEGPHEVDLVLLDMNMPGMSGEETFRRIRELRPGLPIVIATGFVDSGAEQILASGESVSLLAKPYTRAELVGVLAKALPSA